MVAGCCGEKGRGMTRARLTTDCGAEGIARVVRKAAQDEMMGDAGAIYDPTLPLTCAAAAAAAFPLLLLLPYSAARASGL